MGGGGEWEKSGPKLVTNMSQASNKTFHCFWHYRQKQSLRCTRLEQLAPLVFARLHRKLDIHDGMCDVLLRQIFPLHQLKFIQIKRNRLDSSFNMSHKINVESYFSQRRKNCTVAGVEIDKIDMIIARIMNHPENQGNFSNWDNSNWVDESGNVHILSDVDKTDKLNT